MGHVIAPADRTLTENRPHLTEQNAPELARNKPAALPGSKTLTRNLHQAFGSSAARLTEMTEIFCCCPAHCQKMPYINGWRAIVRVAKVP
jgi:hypothetical protein